MEELYYKGIVNLARPQRHIFTDKMLTPRVTGCQKLQSEAA